MSHLTCRICNQSVLPKIMSIHLRAHHQTKFLDYVQSNLNDFRHLGWTECDICGKVTNSKGTKGKACSTVCMTKIRETWTGDKSPRQGAILSDETKAKIGSANSRPNPSIRGKNNPACRKEVREKISKTMIDRGVARGEKNGMFGKTHTPEAIKKIMSHRPMNKLEKVVADKLDKMNIKYTFQFFVNDGEVCKSYDFKLEKKNIIIEVDGDFWHGNPDTKSHHIGVEDTKENDFLKEKMAADRGYKVIRLWERDIKRDPSIVELKLKELVG